MASHTRWWSTGPSSRADAALQDLADAAREGRRRVTVVSLAGQEQDSGCCDTRSVLWNEVTGDLAREELARASRAATKTEAVEFDLLTYCGRHPADARRRACGDRGLIGWMRIATPAASITSSNSGPLAA